MPFVYRREPLTRPELDQLLRACEPGFEEITVNVLVATGLRVSEFCRLGLSDLDYQASTLRVHGKRGPHGSAAPVRYVPVVDLTVWRQLDGLLRTNGNKTTPRTIQRMMTRIARRAGLERKVTPHVLRHTFANEARRRGVSLAALQRALGHEHLSSTQVYQNLSAADVVDDFRRHP